MNILDEHNEWEPKEITLDYKVYKKLLESVVDYPMLIKQLTEDGTHVLIKSKDGIGKDVFALVSNERFNGVKQNFR